jgi:uncharacterized membrane protein YhaH (DUF805 family)
MSSNPYAAPKAAVGDVEIAQEYQEVEFWSASGRLGRLRYLAYTFGAALLCGFVAAILTAALGSAGAIVSLALYLALLVFSVLTTIQRSHDMNWTGWTALLTLIPIVALIWVFKAGSAGANDYGAPPPPNTTGVKILALLMPIVVIIGVVAAIAIPAYADYTSRAAGAQ